MLSELYYIDYYILVFIYVRLVVRLLFFERCKRMTDKQLSRRQGVFVWLFDFLSKKILKRKPHVPEQSLYLRQTEVLFLINRGSVSSQQNLCFSIHSPNPIFYTRGVSHRTTLFPSYSPQYSPNTTIPFKTPTFQPKKICTNSHSCTTFAAASDNVCTMGITRNQQQVNKNTPQ